MFKDFLKKNTQNFIAIGIFIVLSAIVYSPAMQGYSVKQADISSHRGMSKELKDHREANDGEEAIWTNSVFGGMPGYQMNVYYDSGIKNFYKILSLGLPHPVNFMFIAMIGFFFLGRVLKMHYLLAILGAIMYAMITYNVLILEAGHNTKMLTTAYFPAVLASFLMLYRSKRLLLAFAMFSLFLALQLMANHIQMFYYFLFVLVFVGIAELIKALKENRIVDFAKRTGLIILGGMVAFMANFANYNDTLAFSKYTMRGGKVISITPDGKVPEKKAEETKKNKGLDPGYITHWSYGKQETFNLFIPNAKGSSPKTNDMFEKLSAVNRNLPPTIYDQYKKVGGKGFGGYWGDQPGTSGPNYIGAITVFLALLYLLFVHSALKWSLLAVTILTIMLSWGKNLGGLDGMWLTDFFINNVPMYNKFRAVSTLLVVTNLTVPLMAILFLRKLMIDSKWATKNMKNILIGGGSICVILILLMVSPGAFDFINGVEQEALVGYKTTNGISADLIQDSLEDYRKGLFKSDTLRTLGFSLVTLLALFLGIKSIVKFKFLLIALSVLVFADMYTINTVYFNNEKVENKAEYKYWEKKNRYQNTQRPTQGDIDIYKREAALNPEIQKEVNARVQDKRTELGSKFLPNDQESIMFATLNRNTNYRMMDVDNPFNSARASYFHKSTGGYHPAKLRRYQDLIEFYISREISYLNSNQLQNMKVLNMFNNKYYLYQGKLIASNPFAYGNAWFVDEVKWVEDNNEEILAIGTTDVKNVAIVNKEFENIIISDIKRDSSATIKMDYYAPNHIQYTSNSNTNQLAVFSEVYYADGWNAYIDGQKVPHGRADYTLRALNIPAGNKVIEFKFEPSSFKTGNMVNNIGFGIILLTLLAAIFFWYKNDLKQTNKVIDEA